MRQAFAAVLLALAAIAMPFAAKAEVVASSDSGFMVSGEAAIAGRSPAQVWHALIRPQDWWSSDHSWSGDAANMALDPVAGGCFCEAIPGELPGSAEHMRLVQVRPGELLVMRGSLGPMQGEALTGVLSITLAPLTEAAGTKVNWTYVVGGYARFPLSDLAGAVDGVVSEQMMRLQAHQGAAY